MLPQFLFHCSNRMKCLLEINYRTCFSNVNRFLEMLNVLLKRLSIEFLTETSRFLFSEYLIELHVVFCLPVVTAQTRIGFPLLSTKEQEEDPVCVWSCLCIMDGVQQFKAMSRATVTRPPGAASYLAFRARSCLWIWREQFSAVINTASPADISRRSSDTNWYAYPVKRDDVADSGLLSYQCCWNWHAAILHLQGSFS